MNYLKHGSSGGEKLLKVISVRDKISRVQTDINLQECFYIEVKLASEDIPLKLKQIDQT